VQLNRVNTPITKNKDLQVVELVGVAGERARPLNWVGTRWRTLEGLFFQRVRSFQKLGLLALCRRLRSLCDSNDSSASGSIPFLVGKP